MGERALTASLEETEDVAKAHRKEGPARVDSPAIQLLDAMRAGDELGILAVCSDTTVVSADNMGWACRGLDEIREMLVAIRDRFPGITFESRTRHVGFGLVIDEARVQDLRPDDDGDTRDDGNDGAAEIDGAATIDGSVDEAGAQHLAEADATHPMWDEPVSEQRNVLTVWRERPDDVALPPAPLNMPVRVTVRHDDLHVHEVTFSFPAALLKRALGMHVDPLEMSLSEVQSAFIAPVGAGFTTYALARPELTVVPPPPPEPERWTPEDEPPRRRRRLLVAALVVVAAIIAAGGWWVVQGRDSNVVADAPAPSPSAQPTAQPTTQPSASVSPTPQPTSTEAPQVTHAAPSDAPSGKPNITLPGDLAFSINSAKLSAKAKTQIDQLATEILDNGLTGKIYVTGYTDNLGSAASGMRLSQQRANAVSEYLGSQLVGAPVKIVSIGLGERDPKESNATAAGRRVNRRVEITLPDS
jgi:outer membrane protein OmpA-like peptidoglycan-associated protein